MGKLEPKERSVEKKMAIGPWGRMLAAPTEPHKPWLPWRLSQVFPFYAAFGTTRSIPWPCIVGKWVYMIKACQEIP